MKIDLGEFNKLEQAHFLSVQHHPTADLLVWNYTQKTQFERHWTPETLMARGLITDLNGEIISRPFTKFFNLEEHGQDSLLSPLPVEEFQVFDKLDGSLGITYWDQGRIYLATRGSFTSEQALEGTKMLRNLSQAAFDPKLTYLFEVLYPENRIVVDYQGKRGLVLLAIIDTQTGSEWEYDQVKDWAETNGIEVVQRFAGLQDLTKIRELYRENAEGFVVKFKSGVRCKLKYAEYVRLHRLITGVNAKTIWELLKNHQAFEELLERVPEEFYSWVEKTRKDLDHEYEIVDQVICQTIYEKVKDLPTRKEQALAILGDSEDKKYSGIVFRMLDGQPYEEMIWKLIRPAADKPFKVDIDA